MTKIDETRIVPYDKNSRERIAGWRYYIEVLCNTTEYRKGQIVNAFDKPGARRKLRYITSKEQAAGELDEDAAADGFKTRGKCHE